MTLEGERPCSLTFKLAVQPGESGGGSPNARSVLWAAWINGELMDEHGRCPSGPTPQRDHRGTT